MRGEKRELMMTQSDVVGVMNDSDMYVMQPKAVTQYSYSVPAFRDSGGSGNTSAPSIIVVDHAPGMLSPISISITENENCSYSL